MRDPLHVWQLVLVLIIASSAAYAIGRTRWWPGGVLIALSAGAISLGVLHELNDPAIGTALRISFGAPTVFIAKVAAALVGIAPICALLLARSQRLTR